MAILSEEKIFSTAEAIILSKGINKTTLSDIAKMLGVTHAALYKHYKNKDDLLQKLALKWLDNTSKDLFEWSPKKGVDAEIALHDWLWFLHVTKRNLYQNHQKMFLLYTNYIETNKDLIKDHLQHLAKKVEEISGWENKGMAVIVAFTYFHNPYFAERWNQGDHLHLFEQVWSVVSRSH